MDCKEVQKDFFEYLKGWLDLERQERVSAHLKTCLLCAREYGEFKGTLERFGRIGEISPPEGFPERVLHLAKEGRVPRRERVFSFLLWKLIPLKRAWEALQFILAFIRFRAGLSFNFRVFTIGYAVAINILILSLIGTAIVTGWKPEPKIIQVSLESEDAKEKDGEFVEFNKEKLIEALKKEAKDTEIEISPPIDEGVLDYTKRDNILNESLLMENRRNSLRLLWMARSDEEKRKTALARFGGSDQTERAVSKALEWLSKRQRMEGDWDSSFYNGEGGYTIGATSLALLSFLGRGNCGRFGEYQKVVQKGIAFLSDFQKNVASPQGGGMPAALKGDEQVLALMVLMEDFILGDSSEKKKREIEKGLDALFKTWELLSGEEDWSEKKKACFLGWISIFFQVAAKGGFVLDGGGLFSRARGFSLPLAGKEGEMTVKIPPPSKDNLDYVFWFFATYSAFHGQNESEWRNWNEGMKDVLLAMQEEDGSFPCADSLPGGKIQSTALGALILESYYRLLPQE